MNRIDKSKSYQQKLALPIVDWAIRYKLDRELRMWLVARSLFAGDSGYFGSDGKKLLKVACRYISSNKTFERHFQRSIKAGFFAYDGKNWKFNSSSKVALLAKEARGERLAKVVMAFPTELYDMSQNNFRCLLYAAYTHGVHRSNLRYRNFLSRMKGEPSVIKYAEKGPGKNGKDYGQVAYRYLNMINDDDVPNISLSRQSRLSIGGMKMNLVERHWYCNEAIDQMDIRSYDRMGSTVDGLMWSGNLNSTSKIFKAKFGKHKGKFRILEKVMIKWKDEEVKVYFRKKNIFKKCTNPSIVTITDTINRYSNTFYTTDTVL